MRETVDLIRKTMTPPSRSKGGVFLLHLALITALACVPILAPLALHWASGAAQPPWARSAPLPPQAPPPFAAQITAEAEEILGQSCSRDTCDASDILARQSLADWLAQNTETAPQTEPQEPSPKTANARMLYAAGLGFAAVFITAATLAQTRAARRHWLATIAPGDPRRPHPQAVFRDNAQVWVMALIAAGPLIAMQFCGSDLWPLGLIWYLLSGLALPLAGAPLRTSNARYAHSPTLLFAPFLLLSLALLAGSIAAQASLSAFGIWALAFHPDLATGLGTWLLIYAMVMLVVQLSMAGFLTHSAAGHYPNVLRARAFRSALNARKWQILETTSARNPLSVSGQPSKLGLWAGLTAYVESETSTPLPVHPRFTPSAVAEIIEDVGRLAAITLVVAVVAVFLGLDLLTQTGNPDEASAALRHAGVLTFLTGIAVSASLCLGVIYALPMIRIRPYLEAAQILDAQKPAPTAPAPPGKISLHLLRRSRIYPFTLPPAPRRAPPQRQSLKALKAHEQSEQKLQALTGCTARKLDILYLAGSRGGGMHEMMQQNAKGWVVQILTLLAPALASGVLALFS